MDDNTEHDDRDELIASLRQAVADAADLLEASQGEVARLSAPADPQPVAVTVKPLVWVNLAITKEHKGLSGVWLHACGINGQYEVHVFNTEPTHVMMNGPGIVPTAIYTTIAGAKAAAQADYEARILSALTIQPADPLSDPRVVALVEAAKALLFAHDHGNGLEGWYNVREKLREALRAIGGEA